MVTHTLCNFSSEGFDALFWPPQTLHAYGTQMIMQVKHTHTHTHTLIMHFLKIEVKDEIEYKEQDTYITWPRLKCCRRDVALSHPHEGWRCRITGWAEQ